MGTIKTPTAGEVSAGGVAFKKKGDTVEVALICVGEKDRWQLPKGLVGRNESAEEAARREVREEAGIETELIEPLETIDYWFFVTRGGKRVRVHKFVHFFLLRYCSGNVADHDREVNEARWAEIGEAGEMLAFKEERDVLAKARERIAGRRA